MSGESVVPEDRRAALEGLAKALLRAAKDGIAGGRFHPDRFSVVRRTVSMSSGGSPTGGSTAYSDRPAWLNASAALINEMSRMPEYAAAAQAFGKGFEMAVQPLAPAALEGLLDSTASREDILAEIMPALEGSDPPIALLADVMGLKPPSSPLVVHFASGEFEVRCPLKSDLEWEVAAYEMPPLFSMWDPDSIVEARGTGRGNAGAVKLVRTILAGIRLASAGGCACSSLRTVSLLPVYCRHQRIGMDDGTVGVSATDLGDTPPQHRRVREILDEALPRLEQAAYLQQGGAKTEAGIAFERYARASTGNAISEDRIALAVMGMEALLLSESHDLRFSLAMRASRLLGAAGLDPDKVQSDVKLAYDVRSTFVHGGTLSDKLRKKLERQSGSVEQFVLTTLELARRIILACLFPICCKADWIKAIDGTMIGSNKATPVTAVFGRGLDLCGR
jgi:Apea-like HEPN